MNHANEYYLIYQEAVEAFTANDFNRALESLDFLRWNDDFPAEYVYGASFFRERILKEALHHQQRILVKTAKEDSTFMSRSLALKKMLKVPANRSKQELIRKIRLLKEQLLEEISMQRFYELKVHPERHQRIVHYDELPLKKKSFPLAESPLLFEHQDASYSHQNSLYSIDSIMTPVPHYNNPPSSSLDVLNDTKTPLVNLPNYQDPPNTLLPITPLPIFQEAPVFEETQKTMIAGESVSPLAVVKPSFAHMIKKAKQHEAAAEWDAAQEIYYSILKLDNTSWKVHKALLEVTIEKNAPREERLAVCRAFISVYKEFLQNVKSKKNKMHEFYLYVLVNAAVYSYAIFNNENESIQLLEEAVSLAPQDKDVHHFLAAAYKNKSFKNTVRYSLDNTVSVGKNTTSITRNEITEECIFCMRQALFHYNKARELGSVWDKDTYTLTIKLSALSGDFEQGIQYCNQFLDNTKNSQTLLLYVEYRKALFHMEQRDYSRALEILEQLLDRPHFDRDFPEVQKSEFYFDLARVQEQLGHYVKAMGSFSHAMIRDSSNIMYYLAFQRLKMQKKLMSPSFWETAKLSAAQDCFPSLGIESIEIILDYINEISGLKDKQAYLLCLAGGLSAKELKNPKDALCYFEYAQALRPLNELENSTHEKIQQVLQSIRLLNASKRETSSETTIRTDHALSYK